MVCLRALLIIAIATIILNGCATIPREAKVEIAALQSSSPVERGYAAHRLGKNADLAKYAFDELIELLDSVESLQWHKGVLSPRVESWSGYYPGPRATTPRKITISAFVEVGVPAVEALTEALGDDPRPRVRSGAAEALGKIGDRRAEVPLSAALEDENSSVRRSAGSALVAIDPDQGFYVQMAALEDPSFEVRHQAVKELGRLGDARAVPALIRFTEDRSRDAARSLAVREALRALAGIEDPGGLDAAVAAMDHPNALVREDALYAARHMRITVADVDKVLTALKDRSGSVRKEAAITLAELADPSTFDELVLTLFDTEDKARYWAAEALGRIGNREAIGPILDALPESNPIVSRKFYQILQKLSGEKFDDLEKWREWFKGKP